MYLSHLSLSYFRNYQNLDLAMGPGFFIFYGDNAQGKTNLLEAVSVLATASSFDASNDREVVHWQAPEHIARLKGLIKRCEDDIQIDISIFDPTPPAFDRPGMSGTSSVTQTFELPANMGRKRLKLNGTPHKMMTMIGQMKVVLFAPTDLHLVDGSPEERRRFVDRALCQVQPRYCQALVKYRKIVAQRSALLKRIRDQQEDPRLLDYLDEQLTMLANQIMFERERMIAALNAQASQLQATMSSGREHLQIVYRPSFKTNAEWNTQQAPQHYREQLQATRRKEILQGVCLLGPHRDDLEFLVNGVNMLTYGSRGQQRTIALSAKLAELAYMHSSTGDEPILLLDDVFSELDQTRRALLLRQVLQHQQVLLTATDLTSFPEEIVQQARVYQITNGQLKSH